jgi:DNA-binding response OmpR family regulator
VDPRRSGERGRGHPLMVADIQRPIRSTSGAVTPLSAGAGTRKGEAAGCHVGYPALSPRQRRRWLPEGDFMRLVLMTAARQATTEVLPALGLLGHQVRVVAPELSCLLDGDSGDVVLVDARRDLIKARTLCGLLSSTGVAPALIAVLSEGGLVALSADWGVDDVLLDTAGPAEVDARLKWVTSRRLAAAAPADGADGGVTQAGDLVIDEHSYSAKLRGRALDLTYKEFELLKYLAQHPGRVFSRAQLLQEIWGYDYFGGTRTVDVHVRRLRAKLGTEHEALIGTVRNVGYKLDRQVADAAATAARTDAELIRGQR